MTSGRELQAEFAPAAELSEASLNMLYLRRKHCIA